MNDFHEQYVVDSHGNRNAVLLPLVEWQMVLQDLEELDDIREYDEAKSQPSEPVAFEQAVKEIRQGGWSLRYDVFIEKAAQRSLARVPQPYQDRMIAAIAGLSDEPRPAGARKLAGREAWRIRLGDFRIIYEIDDGIRKVLVVSAGNRRDIYRH